MGGKLNSNLEIQKNHKFIKGFYVCSWGRTKGFVMEFASLLRQRKS